MMTNIERAKRLLHDCFHGSCGADSFNTDSFVDAIIAAAVEASREPTEEHTPEQRGDWCPTCKQGWDCAKRDQQSRQLLADIRTELDDPLAPDDAILPLIRGLKAKVADMENAYRSLDPLAAKTFRDALGANQ